MPSNHSVTKSLALLESDTSKTLGLQIGNQTPQPGTYIPKAGPFPSPHPTKIHSANKKTEAQTPPTLSFPGADPSKTYLIIALDIDAPFPSCKILGPILHWIQGGYTVEASSTSGKLESGLSYITNYIGPAPPPMSAPHRYVFVLYEQPVGFEVEKWMPRDGAKTGNLDRMWFSLDEWERKVGVGELVAVNYFKSN